MFIQGYLSASSACYPIGNQPTWDVIIRNGRIVIGCKSYLIGEWFGFSDETISKMHPNALAWWKQVKKPLFALLVALEKWSPPKENKWEDDWL